MSTGAANVIFAARRGFWHYSGVKRRVVFLNSTFPCLSETFVFDQLLALRQMGLDLVIVANHRPREQEVHPRMRDIQAEVLYLNEVSWVEILWAQLRLLLARPGRYLSTLWRAWRAEERKLTTLAHLSGAAVVTKRFGACEGVRLHAHFTYGAAAVARWASELSGVPYGLTLHGSDLSFDFPPDLLAKLSGAELLVSISQFNIDYLKRHFPQVQPKRLAVIGMGVPPLPTPPRTPRGSGPWRILNVGRLSEHKAQHVLIEACHILARDAWPLHCTIVGEGPERARLAKLILERDLGGQVALVGPRFHEEVLALYGEADLFVLCSVAEGMPIVLMEAMRAGVPVIASAITAIPELVQDAGVLVPPEDAPALAKAISCFIRGEHDCAAMVTRGRAIIARDFDLERNHQRFAALLEAL